MEKGSFVVNDQQQIGKGESDPWSLDFSMMISGTEFIFNRPIMYKYTDPVKGELYQPVSIIPVADIKTDKELYMVTKKDSLVVEAKLTPNISRAGTYQLKAVVPDISAKVNSRREIPVNNLTKNMTSTYQLKVREADLNKDPSNITVSINDKNNPAFTSNSYRRIINYDHIPSIVYHKQAIAKSVYIDLKIEGNFVGYIPGAGDKVPEALQQMGYRVITLKESDLTPANLKQFDAIVTGVRAYNTQEWLNSSYDALMQYVNEGGVLMVQYNTNNSIGPVKAKISPYPFTIGRNRITDEDAAVNFLIPDHPALNRPNKITAKDFEGWIQERSTYHAENIDSNYKRILSMKDPGETDQDGSLIIANYGKGRFVYCGLVLFRELPAGVPGAYRLFANLIANDRGKYVK